MSGSRYLQSIDWKSWDPRMRLCVSEPLWFVKKASVAVPRYCELGLAFALTALYCSLATRMRSVLKSGVSVPSNS